MIDIVIKITIVILNISIVILFINLHKISKDIESIKRTILNYDNRYDKHIVDSVKGSLEVIKNHINKYYK